MNALRGLGLAGLVLLALVLQVGVLSPLAVWGVVPHLILLVVIGAALSRGPGFAALTGLVAGLLLDVAPPADHVAGRWALALALAGYLAGRVRYDVAGVPMRAALVAACSFVATSVFALSGLVIGDLRASVSELLAVIAVAVLVDTVVGVLLLPPLLRILARLRPARVALT